MTLRVVKDGLTLEVLQGELDRAAPAYAIVASGDIVPLTLGTATGGGSQDDDEEDGILHEDELEHNGHHQIELPEMRKS